MVKIYQKKQKRYSEADVLHAIESVNNKELSQRKAAKKLGMSHVALGNRMKITGGGYCVKCTWKKNSLA